MEYQKEKLSKNRLKIKVELTADEFDRIFTSKLKELTQTTEVPGFRLGSAPLDLIERSLGTAKVLEQAAERAINQAWQEIILKESIDFLDYPQVEILKLAKGNPFVFTLTLSLWPKVKIGDYKKIKIERRPVTVPLEKINEVLEELREIHRQEILVQRPTKLGDRVELDLELFLDKVPLEGGQIQKGSFLLGKNYFLPNFSENLIGLRPGETKTFFLHYPETHFDKRLAGREVEFRVKLHNVYEVILPRLDDSFAQKVGPFQNLSQLKTEIENNLKSELLAKEEERIEVAVLKNLINISEFEEIPETLVKLEIEKMFNELESSLEQMKIKLQDYLLQIKKTKEDLEKEFIPKAEERIKAVLLVKAVAEREKISVSPDELEAELSKQKELYKNNTEALKSISLPSYRNYFYQILLNRKVLDWLKKEIVK
jgi:trigger factor